MSTKHKALDAIIQECQNKIMHSNNRQDFAIMIQDLATMGKQSQNVTDLKDEIVAYAQGYINTISFGGDVIKARRNLIVAVQAYEAEVEDGEHFGK